MDTPALEQLMGAYLHQDYDLVGDVWDNVDVFVARSPNLAPLLPAEVTWALQAFPNESELEAFLDRLGCQLLPEEEDGGYRGWLTKMAERVAAATRN